MKYIGLMSGTSLDGLDIAYCSIDGFYTSTNVQMLAYKEVKMPKQLKEKIQFACNKEGAHTDDICSLNFELGTWFGESTKQFMDENAIRCDDVDAICSHGQTVYHIPESGNGLVRSTLQLGEAAVIAWITGCRVISDFRSMDMAAGGEGAPLVPYADYLLYRSNTKRRVLVNIGGISNVTFLDQGCREEDVVAFDTGPGNMMIDEAMRHFFQKEYDKDGEVARSGKIVDSLFKELQKEPYIHAAPPKSTGRELFGKQRVERILAKYKEDGKDIVTTLTHFTAWSIAENIHQFLEENGNVDEVIVSGGGAHNHFLLELIQYYMQHAKVMCQEDLGFSSDAKEAICFALLGNETLHLHYSNMKSATGAKEKVILGNITPAIRRFE